MTEREEKLLTKLKETIEKVLGQNINESSIAKSYYFLIAKELSGISQSDISKHIDCSPGDFNRHYTRGVIISKESDFDKTTIKKIKQIVSEDLIVQDSGIADLISKVREFRYSFNLPSRETPSLIPSQEFELNYKLSNEENLEYLDACEDNDKVEILDALVDELYIWCGKVLSHGMQDLINEAFKEVHASNMSKLDANGFPIKRVDGKVMKGENYFKPNLVKFLK